MKKIIISLMAVGLVGAGTYAGGVFYAGNKAEQAFLEDKAATLNQLKQNGLDQFVQIGDLKITNKTLSGADLSYEITLKIPMPAPKQAPSNPSLPAPGAMPQQEPSLITPLEPLTKAEPTAIQNNSAPAPVTPPPSKMPSPSGMPSDSNGADDTVVINPNANVTMPPPALGNMTEEPQKPIIKEIKLTFEETIKFGPVVATDDGMKLAWFVSESKNIFNDKNLAAFDAPEAIKKYFKDHPNALQTRYVLGLNNERHMFLKHAAFKEKLGENLDINIPAGIQEMSYKVGKNKNDQFIMTGLGANINLPQITITDAKDNMTVSLDGLSLNTDSSGLRESGLANDSKGKFAIKKIEVTKGKDKLLMQDVAIESNSDISKEFMNADFAVKVNKIECGFCPPGSKIPSSIDIASEVNHIDAQALDSLLIAMNAARQEQMQQIFSSSRSHSMNPMALGMMMLGGIQDLITKDPEFKITKLVLKGQNNEDINASLLLKTIGFAKSDLCMGSLGNPDAILQKIQLNLDVKVHKGWLSAMPPMALERLNDLVSKKLLKQEGDNYHITFKLEKGQFTVGDLTANGMQEFQTKIVPLVK